ncbi:hypothetical protein DPMN_059226 [Dreissena polymorpha]|uniref:Uncharacterized protein n=1 Tax=Dreissena polymorpha TaxID=45954 RepID=A0A9D4C3Q3_DREPO|nr:hypothetical protein DPMN_059226 [Dreissena polymorpha]
MRNSSGKVEKSKRDKRDKGTGHGSTVQADGRTAIPDESSKMPEQPGPGLPKPNLPDSASGPPRSERN